MAESPRVSSSEPKVEPLAAEETRLHAELPASSRAAGQIRLAELVDLLKKKNFPHNHPRATIIRLEKKLGSGQSPADGRPRSHSYLVENALSILLACHLIQEKELSTTAAAEQVKRYRTTQRKFGGAHLVETLLKVSLERFEVHVLGRLTGALLNLLNDSRDLRPGTVVFFDRGPGLRRDANESDEDWAGKRAQELVTHPRPRTIALVGEDTEMVFLHGLPRTVLEPRKYRVLHFDASSFGAIFVAELFSQSTPPHVGERPNAWATGINRTALADRLLDAIGPAFDELRKEAISHVPVDRAVSENTTATTSQKDFMLWLLTVYGAIVASTSEVAAARCTVMIPDRLDRKLKMLASSDVMPWSIRGRADAAIRLNLGQLLSGYAARTNLTLAVPRSDSPHDVLVAHHAFERRVGNHGALRCVAIPIPLRESGEKAAPVLYVWMSPDGPEPIDATIKILQVLAPVAGELIQRTLDTTHTLRATAEAALTRFLSNKELPDAVCRALAALVARAESEKGPPAGDERIAFVVFNAAPPENAIHDWGTEWLADQLRYLIPRSLLPVFLHADDGGATALSGQLTKMSAVLMIPRRLRKDELDQLRKSVPTHVNKLGDAVTDSDEPISRLGAWIVDVKWADVVEKSNSAALRSYVDVILGRCITLASVIEDNIASYRYGFNSGDWTRALGCVKSGLDRAPSNAYLLRRAAEFSAYVGDFEGAQRFAVRAVATEEALVAAHCLLGDALLGQGLVRASVDEYRKAAVDKRNPLPLYCEGFALLTVVRLLRATGDARAWKHLTAETHDPVTFAKLGVRLRCIKEHAEILCTHAAAAHRTAQKLLTNWGTAGLHPIHNFLGASNAYALTQTESMKINPSGVVHELTAARKAYPRDGLLARELFFAQMWTAGVGDRLFDAYGVIASGDLMNATDEDKGVPRLRHADE